jgi:hypothetical protein
MFQAQQDMPGLGGVGEVGAHSHMLRTEHKKMHKVKRKGPMRLHIMSGRSDAKRYANSCMRTHPPPHPSHEKVQPHVRISVFCPQALDSCSVRLLEAANSLCVALASSSSSVRGLVGFPHQERLPGHQASNL